MNKGILVRIDWNDHRWTMPSDLTDVNFGYAKEKGLSHTAFNFAHDTNETEPDGLWYGLVPSFHKKTPDEKKIRQLKVVFMISLNNQVDKTFVVGLYAFPKFGKKIREKPIKNFEQYNEVNIAALPSNIYCLNNPISLDSLNTKRLLGDQEISTQGWNYLSDSGTGYLLDEIDKVENSNTFKKIKFAILK
jgi:hypothetical protein